MEGFLSSQWRVTSAGMMAGSCISVILLVIALEALRRASREYDAYILRQFASRSPAGGVYRTPSDSDGDSKNPRVAETAASHAASPPCAPTRQFRPSLVQQIVRATLHMLQFAAAYFVSDDQDCSERGQS